MRRGEADPRGGCAAAGDLPHEPTSRSTAGEQIRCFLAANIATEPSRNLQSAQRQLREALRDLDLPLRWVPVENIHLTFKFLGEVSPVVVATVERALAPLLGAEPPLVFDLAGVGAFPSAARPRVLWVGVREPETPRLPSLFARIEDAFAGLGFPREERPFKPHLTLARAKPEGRPADLSETLERFAGIELGRTVARELWLYRSELRPQGARYTALQRICFQETP
jgi:2'-5' RNA ligase